MTRWLKSNQGLAGCWRRAQEGPRKGLPDWKKSINSHEAFTHDSIDSLGYDWERISNPSIAPKFPLKIYLPQTTEDIVSVVKEVKELGEKLTVRAKGHSSNDLVLGDGGPVMLTEKLGDLIEVDEENLTATVQGGAVSANIDDALAQKGLGLPVIGDHNHVTVGGFVSVGGISPASHRFGLFVDNVLELELVTWDGELVKCSRQENSELFHKVLCGLGREGVIATVKVRVIQVDKFTTVLKNHQKHYRKVNDFVKASGRRLRKPGDALYERGVSREPADEERAAAHARPVLRLPPDGADRLQDPAGQAGVQPAPFSGIRGR